MHSSHKGRHICRRVYVVEFTCEWMRATLDEICRKMSRTRLCTVVYGIVELFECQATV